MVDRSSAVGSTTIDHDAVGERGDDHVREEVVDERQPSVDRALARVDRFQLQDVAEREGHPAVGTEAFDEVDVVELHGEERVGMGEAQVIALEERLHLHLPVGRLLPLGGAEQLVLGADEPGDLVEGVIGRRIAVLVDHDETVPLPAGHRHEAPRGCGRGPGSRGRGARGADCRRGGTSTSGTGRRTTWRSPTRRRAGRLDGGRRCGTLPRVRRHRGRPGSVFRRRRGRRTTRRAGARPTGTTAWGGGAALARARR